MEAVASGAMNRLNVNQARCEALFSRFAGFRAGQFVPDGQIQASYGHDVRGRFGYTRWAMINLVRDHRAGKLELFAQQRKPGPAPGTAPARERVRGQVVKLRQGKDTPRTRSPPGCRRKAPR